MFFTASRASAVPLAFLLALVLPAGAATFVLQPDDSGSLNGDAFVDQGTSQYDTSNFNYGGAGVIAVAAAGLPKGQFQSLLRFDLSSVKTSFDTTLGAGQWIVTDVKLQLTAKAPTNGLFNGTDPFTPQNAAGHFNTEWIADDSWEEGAGNPVNPETLGVNFNTLANYLTSGVESLNVGGVPFSFDGSNTSTNQYTLRLGAGLLNDIYGGSLASFRLSAADATISALFLSRNQGKLGAAQPALIFNAVAVPEPGRGLLLTAGLATLLLRRKRRACFGRN